MQTDKIGNQENNAAILDHGNITNIQVWLNHSIYPSVDRATDFIKEPYIGAYYGIDNLLAASGVSPAAFKSPYPIQVFGVSQQNERLTEGVVDLSKCTCEYASLCSRYQQSNA